MHHEFWHDKWESGEIGFHQNEINPHLTTFWHMLASPPAKVFVPLCGKTKDVIWLRDQGYSVLGVELSPIAVTDFFAENLLQPEISTSGLFEKFEVSDITMLCGDFFELKGHQLDDISVVYDRASLVALPPEMRPDYANHLQRILPANCCILLVTFDYDQEIVSGPPFSISDAELSTLFGSRYTIETVHSEDLMAGSERERWQTRGLSTLEEKVHILRPK